MTARQTVFEVATRGPGLYEITRDVADWTRGAGETSLLTLFVQHTSASLLVQENADPDVLGDIERWFSGAVQDGDARFRHRAEGDDDMSAHIRTLLTQTSLTVPIDQGRLALGTWQAIYLFEHRTAPHHRKVSVTILG